MREVGLPGIREFGYQEIVTEKRDIIVGLDVGTSKIVVLVGEADENYEIRITGVGEHTSQGLRKGEVVNLDAAVAAIEEAVEKAEGVCAKEIRRVYTAVGGGGIRSMDSRAVVAVAKPRSGVTEKDIERAVDMAQAISLPRDREVIKIIPQEFAVDGQRGIVNPQGIVGSRLETQVHIVTAHLTSVQNLVKVINQAGLEIEDYIFQSLASSHAVLRPEEQKAGVVVIDIGGGTTDSILFQGEVIRHTGVVSIGGDHVTNDISIGLKLFQGQAEEVKKKYGRALVSGFEEETISVAGASGRSATLVSRKKLCQIIESRMSELFSLLRCDLERNGLFRCLGSGVVLTGGGALLEEVTALAEKVLELPVRVGKPWGVTGLIEVKDSPAYAAAVGLVKYGSDHRRHVPAGGFWSGGKVEGAIRGMREWIERYF